MRVGLFIPCYIDQLYPDVAKATVEVLQRLGIDFDFPSAQTCCGQPMANTGCDADAKPLAERFVRIFADYDNIVCPSGSCVAMVRHHYRDYFEGAQANQPKGTGTLLPAFEKVSARTFELCEFLHDIVKVDGFDVRFPHRVGLHQSCHGLRELRLGASSETMNGEVDKVGDLLKTIEGLQLTTAERPDECCGFGGTFAVNEADVSAAMGRDRIADHRQAGAEVLVAGDMSCLMHLQGLIRRDRTPLPVMHVAQVLAGRELPVRSEPVAK